MSVRMTVYGLPGRQNGRWLNERFSDRFSLAAHSERRSHMVGAIAALLVLLFAVGPAAAQDAKESAPKVNYVIGAFESYKNEILTLKVENRDKKFKVPGDTNVGYATGKDKVKTKVEKAKEHLKDVKKGSFVSVTLDNDGKKVLAVGVFVPELPEDKPKDKNEDKDK
jgi:hypothetical protein